MSIEQEGQALVLETSVDHGQFPGPGRAEDSASMRQAASQAAVEPNTRDAQPTQAEPASSRVQFVGPAFLDSAPYLVEAAIIFMGSYLRSVQGLSEIGMRLQPTLMSAYAAELESLLVLGRANRHELVESLRALLREIGDGTLLEARRLESELSDLREKLARTVAPAVTEAAYRRMWKVKP